eukprot:s2340_g27.t1
MAQFQGQSEVFLRVWRLLDAMPEDPDDGVMREKWEKEPPAALILRAAGEEAQACDAKVQIGDQPEPRTAKVAPQEDQNLGQEEVSGRPALKCPASSLSRQAVTHQFRQEPPQKAGPQIGSTWHNSESRHPLCLVAGSVRSEGGRFQAGSLGSHRTCGLLTSAVQGRALRTLARHPEPGRLVVLNPAV